MHFSDIVSLDFFRPLAAVGLTPFDCEAYRHYARGGAAGFGRGANSLFVAFLRWRRLTLVLVCAMLCGDIAWRAHNSFPEESGGGLAADALAFGYVADVSVLAATTIQLVGAAFALRRHADWARSRRALVVSFLVGFCALFAPYLFPFGRILARSMGAMADAFYSMAAAEVEQLARASGMNVSGAAYQELTAALARARGEGVGLVTEGLVLYCSALATANCFVALAPASISL